MNICKSKGCNKPVKNKYCSVGCSNKNRKHSDKTKQKISKAIKNKFKNDKSYRNNVLSKLQSREAVEKRIETYKNRLLSEDFENLSYDAKRKRIIIEQDYKCNNCNLDKWLDSPISLEIDHIDGDRNNSIRGNMEGLCPNCHSLTDTWKGRNKNNFSGKKVSDKDLYEAIKSTDNVRQALLKVDLAPKGNNYKRVRNLMIENNMDQ